MLRQKPPGGNNNSASKRALSHAEIVQCERATQPSCDCRCGGALHGANRAPSGDDGRAFFEGLPASDPHHLQTTAERRDAARSSRRRRRDERRRLERDAFFAEKDRRRAERVAAWEREGIDVSASR